jgi:dUTP pyrophosphatase
VGAVAFDLVVRETKTIAPDEIAAVPVNIIVATPPGYMFMIAARSSLARKKRLVLPNSVGIVDQDYCGPKDEVCVQLWNIGKTPSTVERGERIAQAMFVKIERAEWNEIDEVVKPSRGGFGSTGGYIGS